MVKHEAAWPLPGTATFFIPQHHGLAVPHGDGECGPWERLWLLLRANPQLHQPPGQPAVAFQVV